MERQERIRRLNDAFRTTFIGGQVMLTEGVSALEQTQRGKLFGKVRTFGSFDQSNDPHAEHGFGAINLEGERYFWKIDYYDPSCEFGSADPSDPGQTCRVLSIMRADEY